MSFDWKHFVLFHLIWIVAIAVASFDSSRGAQSMARLPAEQRIAADEQ